MLITQAEFARLTGVSRSAIKQAINKGLITAITEQAGKVLINKTEGLAQYSANSRRQKNKTQTKPVQPAPTESGLEALSWGQAKTVTPTQPLKKTPTNQELRDLIQSLPEDEIPDLNESRARREHYQAEKARLEALQGRGELVPAADVRKEAFALARAVRDKLMGIADRLAPMLAATQDPVQCHRLINEEIRLALMGLADG